MNLKKEIQEKLYRKDGKLNSAILRQKWFLQSDMYKQIYEHTIFLNKDVSISERIYCIIKDIKSIPLCPVCKKKLNYTPKGPKYLEYCSQTCRRKLEYWGTSKNKDIVYLRKQNLLKIFKNLTKIKHTLNEIKTFINSRIDETNYGEKHQLINSKHLNENCDILADILFLTKNIVKIKESNFKWSKRFFCIIKNFKNKEDLICKICGNKLSFWTIKTGFTCKTCNIKRGKFQKNKEYYQNQIIKSDFEILSQPINLNEGSYKLKCNQCRNINDYKLNNGGIHTYIYCQKCERNLKTQQHKILEHILKDNKLVFKENDRTVLNGKELDIYFPNEKVAIEYNGLYWHSELNGIDKKYHLNKTNLCKEKGIHLIHIFEDDWFNKKNIVLSRLNNIIFKNNNKIGARKCKVKEISTKDKSDFLNKNHIQGDDKSSIKLGLFYNEELMTIMTFGKSRFNKKYEWELIRFCSLQNYTVQGGAQKLLTFFKKQYNPQSIITYADRCWSNGNLYEKIGFNYSHISQPNYWYIENGKKVSRIKFQKHKLSTLLENFDSNKTEWENMQQNGYDRIWDCGNLVYIWEK